MPFSNKSCNANTVSHSATTHLQWFSIHMLSFNAKYKLIYILTLEIIRVILEVIGNNISQIDHKRFQKENKMEKLNVNEVVID